MGRPCSFVAVAGGVGDERGRVKGNERSGRGWSKQGKQERRGVVKSTAQETTIMT